MRETDGVRDGAGHALAGRAVHQIAVADGQDVRGPDGWRYATRTSRGPDDRRSLGGRPENGNAPSQRRPKSQAASPPSHFHINPSAVDHRQRIRSAGGCYRRAAVDQRRQRDNVGNITHHCFR